MKTLFWMLALALHTTACSGTTEDNSTKNGDTIDMDILVDAGGDTSTPGGDTSTPLDGAVAEPTCYEGWSGDADCCLTGTAQTAVSGACPTGLFTESECGRLDPICESADVGLPPGDAGLGMIEEEMLAATNAARATEQDCGAEGVKAPVGALTLNAQLTAAAQRHADDMAANEQVSPRGSDGSGPGDRATDAGYPSPLVMENTTFGAAGVTEAIAAWLGFESTCANMMDADRTEMGAGYAVGSDGKAYWSQVLGQQ